MDANPKDRSPMEELANRAATSGAGLAAAAKAVALQDHKRMLDDNAVRLREGHEAQMKAAGFEPAKMEDDMSGDVSVTGDIHIHQPTEPPENKPTTTQPASKLATLALTALLSAGGGAGLVATIPGLISGLTTQPKTATEQGADDDTQYELRLSGGDKKE